MSAPERVLRQQLGRAERELELGRKDVDKAARAVEGAELQLNMANEKVQQALVDKRDLSAALAAYLKSLHDSCGGGGD
ncbi:MAG TPA: hypothetical protein VHO06_22340 [Polyangia bacterium]|nr:hypothetical protein [Polyangia bacterium]